MFLSALMMGAKAPVVPLIRDAGYTAAGSTSFAAPAVAEVGDLLIAGRTSTSGSVQGMGGDFTAIGDSAAITLPYDVNFGWRIVTATSATHTIPTGGVGVIWSIWRAGTFNASSPVSGWSVTQENHTSVTWASTATTADKVVVGGGWSVQSIVLGLIPGATLMSENLASNPYRREFRRIGGWAGQAVAHEDTGSAGQFTARWNYTINGA